MKKYLIPKHLNPTGALESTNKPGYKYLLAYSELDDLAQKDSRTPNVDMLSDDELEAYYKAWEEQNNRNPIPMARWRKNNQIYDNNPTKDLLIVVTPNGVGRDYTVYDNRDMIPEGANLSDKERHEVQGKRGGDYVRRATHLAAKPLLGAALLATAPYSAGPALRGALTAFNFGWRPATTALSYMSQIPRFLTAARLSMPITMTAENAYWLNEGKKHLSETYDTYKKSKALAQENGVSNSSLAIGAAIDAVPGLIEMYPGTREIYSTAKLAKLFSPQMSRLIKGLQRPKFDKYIEVVDDVFPSTRTIGLQPIRLIELHQDGGTLFEKDINKIKLSSNDERNRIHELYLKDKPLSPLDPLALAFLPLKKLGAIGSLFGIKKFADKAYNKYLEQQQKKKNNTLSYDTSNK